MQLASISPRPNLAPIELLELGCVYVNNVRVVESTYNVKANDLLRVHSNPRRFLIPKDLKRLIVRESQDYLIVDKPAGLPTESLVDNLRENLTSLLRNLVSSQLFPVYEVDIETSGLVVFAKSEAACEKYKGAFKEGKVTRTFVAFTEAAVKGTHTEAPIRIVSCVEQSASTDLITEGRSTWSVQNGPLQSLYRVEIEQASGRPSEVRDFLANQGAPILGDRQRGSEKELKNLELGKNQPAFCVVSLGLESC